MTDIIVGLSLIASGIAILVRRFRRPPEIIGRNEAVKRILERARPPAGAQ